MSRSNVSKRERALLTRRDLLQFAEQITRHSDIPGPASKLSHRQGSVLKPITYDVDLFTFIDPRRIALGSLAADRLSEPQNILGAKQT